MTKRERERSRRSGSSRATEHKAAIKVAYIGAGATLLAAIIGGAFLLLSSHKNDSPSDSNLHGRPDLTILSMSFARTRTGEIINVRGFARNIPNYEAVYAVAKPNVSNANRTLPAAPAANTESWFVGGPAKVGKDGLWSIKINVNPVLSSNLTVAAVELGASAPEPSCAPGLPCSPAPPGPLPPSIARIDLETYGPNSDYVVRTSFPKHATIPSG